MGEDGSILEGSVQGGSMFEERRQLADLVADRDAQIKRMARAARDKAAASGTLVWDPFDPAWRDDPYAVYAKLRDRNPVHHNCQ